MERAMELAEKGTDIILNNSLNGSSYNKDTLKKFSQLYKNR